MWLASTGRLVIGNGNQWHTYARWPMRTIFLFDQPFSSTRRYFLNTIIKHCILWKQYMSSILLGNYSSVEHQYEVNPLDVHPILFWLMFSLRCRAVVLLSLVPQNKCLKQVVAGDQSSARSEGEWKWTRGTRNSMVGGCGCRENRAGFCCWPVGFYMAGNFERIFALFIALFNFRWLRKLEACWVNFRLRCKILSE